MQFGQEDKWQYWNKIAYFAASYAPNVPASVGQHGVDTGRGTAVCFNDSITLNINVVCVSYLLPPVPSIQFVPPAMRDKPTGVDLFQSIYSMLWGSAEYSDISQEQIQTNSFT